jgi:ATP phosphoribosyltransferase regulatory subunit
MVFAAYADNYKGPLALGGRYDEVGQVFGRARPATGFSLDLRGLVIGMPPAKAIMTIFAPSNSDKSLSDKIDHLRAEGHIVIQELTGTNSNILEMNCDRKLVHYNSGWHVVAIEKNE